MHNLYIPIKVKGNKRSKSWFMDVSNLTLSQLIDLRKELIAYADSVSVIDGVIREKHLEKLGYCPPEYYNKRESKKIRKRERIEKIKRSKERKIK